MLIKYIVNFQDFIFALKYDPIKNAISIGSNGRFLPTLVKIMEYYFNESYQTVWTQKNKVRLISTLKNINFETSIEKMTIDGIYFKNEKTLGRIMR